MRFVKTSEEIERLLSIYRTSHYHPMKSVTVMFETDESVIRAVLPPPLAPAAHPIALLNINDTAWADCSGPVRGATLQVLCEHEGIVGTYCLSMQMTTDHAVLFGRDLFGEPKKVATIALDMTADRLHCAVERYGVTFIEVEGEIAEGVDPGPARTSYGYLFKYLPDCSGAGLEDDPRLVRVTYTWEASLKRRAQARVLFRESIHDPIIDLPVGRVLDASYEIGRLTAHAQVVGRVDRQEFLPYAFLKMDAFDRFG